MCWGGGGCGCGLWVVWLLKAGDTRYSQPVTHASTDRAQRCLTAVIGREPVLSTWYGRRQLHIHSNCTSTLHTLTPNTQPITTTRQHTQSIFIHSITHSHYTNYRIHSHWQLFGITTTNNSSTYPFNATTTYTDQLHYTPVSTYHSLFIHTANRYIDRYQTTSINISDWIQCLSDHQIASSFRQNCSPMQILIVH